MNKPVGTTDNLNELIEIAEKSSNTIKSIDKRIARLKILMLLISMFIPVITLGLFIYANHRGSFDLFYSKDLFWGFSTGAGMGFVILAVGVLVKSFYDIKNLRKERQRETRILRRLLEMIDELRSFLFQNDEINPVNKALIEIKLSRISFDSSIAHPII